jgi:hypothetical protein
MKRLKRNQHAVGEEILADSINRNEVMLFRTCLVVEYEFPLKIAIGVKNQPILNNFNQVYTEYSV